MAVSFHGDGSGLSSADPGFWAIRWAKCSRSSVSSLSFTEGNFATQSSPSVSMTLALGRAPPSEQAERARRSSICREGTAFFSFAASTPIEAAARALRPVTEGTGHFAWRPMKSPSVPSLHRIPPMRLNSSVKRKFPSMPLWPFLTEESDCRKRKRNSIRPQRSGNVSLIKEKSCSPSGGYCLPASFCMSPPRMTEP